MEPSDCDNKEPLWNGISCAIKALINLKKENIVVLKIYNTYFAKLYFICIIK